MLTLDFKGEFNLTDGDQIYVLGGHGKPGSGVVFWGEEKNEKYWLSAETVAERTAQKFPTLYLPRPVTANIANKPSKEPIPGITIKIYSCHSAEGGYDSFANRFARAFRAFLCTGVTYEITIFGYTGRISPKPQILSEGNITMAKDLEKGRKLFPGSIPEHYTGPKESVKKGAEHRWSKINPFMYQSRASEARSKVPW